MNTKFVTFSAIILSSFVTNLVAMNYDDARRILANEPFLPTAGETPQSYQQRLAEYKTRKNLNERYASARSEVIRLKSQASKLGLQIQTGMLIPDNEEEKPSPLTDEQKAAMLSELLRLQEQIVRAEAISQDLASAIMEDNANIEKKSVSREIRQQTQELRRELRKD